MSYALWLNRRKVCSASEIADNLDLASLCGYFTAGSLVGWLKEHGGEQYARALEEVSPKDPALKDRLAEVFGGKPVKYRELKGGGTQTGACSIQGTSALYGASSFNSSGLWAMSSGGLGVFGSWIPSWKLRLLGSFNFTSYSYRSYLLNIGFGSGFGGYAGSYLYSGGSFGYEWEWEWERFLKGLGSFNSVVGSYAYSSFISALRAFFSVSYGYSSFGSFGAWRFGSWRFGSFGAWNLGSWSKLRFSRSSYGGVGSFGSFTLGEEIDSDEYDRILMECLFGCRLNGYGYGIHNV